MQTDTIIGTEIGLSGTLQDNLFSGGGYHQTGARFGGKGRGDQQGEADDQSKGFHGKAGLKEKRNVEKGMQLCHVLDCNGIAAVTSADIGRFPPDTGPCRVHVGWESY